MLTGVPDPERIELFAAFAERVRRGHYGNGTRVRAGTVQVALRAIGKTFEMDGLPNPTYRSEGKYWLQLERLIKAYRRQDPPAQHKLAVPVSLVTYLHSLGQTSPYRALRDQFSKFELFPLYCVLNFTRQTKN